MFTFWDITWKGRKVFYPPTFPLSWCPGCGCNSKLYWTTTTRLTRYRWWSHEIEGSWVPGWPFEVEPTCQTQAISLQIFTEQEKWNFMIFRTLLMWVSLTHIRIYILTNISWKSSIKSGYTIGLSWGHIIEGKDWRDAQQTLHRGKSGGVALASEKATLTAKDERLHSKCLQMLGLPPFRQEFE